MELHNKNKAKQCRGKSLPVFLGEQKQGGRRRQPGAAEAGDSRSPEGKLSCCETACCNSAASFQEQTEAKGFKNKRAELFDGHFSISAFELGTQAPACRDWSLPDSASSGPLLAHLLLSALVDPGLCARDWRWLY